MTFPGLEKIMEFHDFSRFSMTGYTLSNVLRCLKKKFLFCFEFNYHTSQIYDLYYNLRLFS